MKKLIITVILIFIAIIPVNSQHINQRESFIHNFSIGAGLGFQELVQNYLLSMNKSSLLGNFLIQYQINKNLSANINTAFKVDSKIEISYATIGGKYSYFNYENTLLPYIGLDLGAYFYEDFKARYDDWPEYVGRRALLGGSIGTGLDLKMSKLATLDLNVKLHSFELARSNSNYFITVITNLRINL